MAEKRSIYQFATGTPAATTALLCDSADTSAASGYTTEKLLLSDLGSFLNGGLNYTQQLNTDAKNIFGAINELLTAINGVKYIELTETLEAGETEITFTDDSITENSTLDIYADVYGVNPKTVTLSEGEIVITFDALDENINIKVRVS